VTYDIFTRTAESRSKPQCEFLGLDVSVHVGVFDAVDWPRLVTNDRRPRVS
jgi:hypothetical protein